MKKKSIFLTGLIMLLSSVILQSCKDDDDDVYYYNSYAYAIGDMVVKEGESPYLQLDSKKTMLPSNTSIPSFFLRRATRNHQFFSITRKLYGI